MSDPAPAPAPTIGQPYTVREGDTITEIAYVAYGDARRYVELVEHNRGVPGFNAARLRTGIVLDIPRPDYLPMPSGIGGMRTSAGRSFKAEARPVAAIEARAPVPADVVPDVPLVRLVRPSKESP
jgi:phage tail protein X